MPLTAEQRRTVYGPDWRRMSAELRATAKRCTCRGECGQVHVCAETSRLQVGHRNHTPGDDRPENLAVWCSACHMRHDRFEHRRRRDQRAIRAQLDALEAAGQLVLPWGQCSD